MFDKQNWFSILSILLLGISDSCTKLDTKVYDSVPVTNFWRTTDEIAAGVAPAYSGDEEYVGYVW